MPDAKSTFGILLMLALFALRVIVGWQFYNEGRDKLEGDGFTSAGFLKGAKGPLAHLYVDMAPRDDDEALLDRARTERAFDKYRFFASKHYEYGEKDNKSKPERLKYERLLRDRRDELEKEHQAIDGKKNPGRKETLRIEISFLSRDIEQVRSQEERSHEIQAKYLEMYDNYLAINAPLREKYERNIARRERIEESEAMQDVASLSGQAAQTEAERQKERAELIGGIKQIWDAYEGELAALAIDDQREDHGPLPLYYPGERSALTDFLDVFIPWFDLALGVLLILGLFTRLSASVGALFMLGVVLSQFPGAAGAAPTYYQWVLLLSLVVLAVSGAGRFLGLDMLFSAFRGRFSRPRRATVRPSYDAN